MPRRLWLWPTVVVVVGLVLTLLAVVTAYSSNKQADELRFINLTDRIRAEIVRRIGVYHYGLMGTRSVFAASETVERGEFRALVAARNLREEFPGAIGLGFIRRVNRADMDKFIQRTRADQAPNFQIKSSGTFGSLYILEYVEPIESNFAAVGYDLAQEPIRQEAADRAMRTGEASLTGHVKLIQNGQDGPGFIYLLPVYKNGAPISTPEERIANLEGWIYMPLLASRIFKGVGDVADREIDFEVFDGDEAVMSALVYDDDAHLSRTGGDLSDEAYQGRLFKRTVQLELGGRQWTVNLTTSPRFLVVSSAGLWGIGITGIFLTTAATMVLLALGSTAHRARVLAQRMTRDMHRLALVAETTTNAVVITDAVGHIDWVNNGFVKLTGFSLQQVRGKLISVFLETDVADKKAIADLIAAISAGRDCRVELVSRAMMGREYVVDIELQPVRSDNQQLIGFVVVETDITAQITHRNQLNSIFRAMAEGLVVISSDGVVLNCNPEAERIMGVTRDQIFHRIGGPGAGAVREDGTPWPVQDLPVLVTLKTGEAVRGAHMGQYRPDGSLFWISINTQAIRASDGRIEAVVATFSDITQQIRATNDLDIKERMLRTMIDQSRQLAGILSVEGILLDVNRTSLSFAGIKDRNQVVGKPFWDGPWWRHSDQLREWLKGAVARAARGETVRSQVTHADAGGAIRFVDFSITPVVSGEGKVVMLIPEGWDVTESKLAADALAQARDAADTATKSKSEFLANMSHEIRTPMTAILGYTDLLAEEWETGLTPRQRLEYIATIKRNGEHLLSIINDILDLSKIETGKMTVERIDTYPDQIIHDVLSLMNVKAQAKGLKLDVQNITALPERIQSDPLRLRQILVNLVGNAIKFTEVGGVTVRLMLDRSSVGGPFLKFEVRDTGIGMTSEQMARLFGAFEQADASTTRKFGGTGLGLRISKRLAEMLGGDITASSLPGNGSTFTLRLATGPLEGVPMVEQGQASQIVRESRPPSQRTQETNLLAGARILMAEDGPDNQRLVAHHLRKSGAIVTIVENGELAVRAMTKDSSVDGRLNPAPPFDLILMDMQMPIMDGYTATRLLRTKGSTVPIIALTAHAMSGDADKCLDAGCDDYTAKPIDRAKLIAICAAWIGKDRHFTTQDSDLHRVSATSTLSARDVQAPEKQEEVLVSTLADDSALTELISEFVSKLPERANDIQRLCADGDYEELTRMAHQMAGAAGSYGYPTLTDAGRNVETMLRKGSADPKALKEACDALARLCRLAWAGLNQRK